MPSERKLVPLRVPVILHGGDYNPEQWLDWPEVIEEDFGLMDRAHVNALTVGMFSWSRLEPREGHYDFDWLDRIMDRIAATGRYAILGTPSGARPAWMSKKYPEVLRVGANRVRNLHGFRHNHCPTSPVYREKVRAINRLLAERYREHKALVLWHISNEFGGECFCDLCRAAFRDFVRVRYQDDLDALNRAWWAHVWSHTFTDWDELDCVGYETQIHGMNLDWRRFVTAQTASFIQNEAAPLRELSPNIPITTNFMAFVHDLDYSKLAEELDVLSWDSYPAWHRPGGDVEEPAFQGFVHDQYRAMHGGRPFLLMESTPSISNWQPYGKLKQTGLHRAASLLAVAHGADSVLYFQWRASRGAVEKLHGAVVDHTGSDQTRVFKEVAELGRILERLTPVVGATTRAEVAILYDWENRWALDDAVGISKHKDYVRECFQHYLPFWRSGIPVDVVHPGQDLSGYRLVIAPMLYMVKEDTAKALREYVERGGTFVTTFFTGMVGETDLCFRGGFPGPLRPLLGIWQEEIDGLYPEQQNSVQVSDEALGLDKTYAARQLCALIHAEGATVLGRYGADFYAGRPALTRHGVGSGSAYFIASRNDEPFLSDFYGALASRAGVRRLAVGDVPAGVTVQEREKDGKRYLFALNFTDQAARVELAASGGTDLVTGASVSSRIELGPYGCAVVEAAASAP